MIVRTSDKRNTVANALDEWSLNNVAALIDAVADGHPPRKQTWHQLRELARLDLRMMPRLCKLAQAIFDKYERGELTQAEAMMLSGVESATFEAAPNCNANGGLTGDTCKCGKPGLPLHPCPYDEETDNDSTPTCNCCEACQDLCIAET